MAWQFSVSGPKYHLPCPEHHEPASSDILDRAAQFYTDRLTGPVLRYLAGRGFPEAFVRQRRNGFAPVSSTRDFLVRQVRGAARSNRTQVLREAIEAGLVVQDKARAVRDFFASETQGYILFPNVVHGRVVDLQARAYPTPAAAALTSTGRSQSTTCTMLVTLGSDL
jgi:hypothetical protein